MIELLVTCDENYLNPLQVMLYSLKQNNQNDEFRIWLIHESISAEAIAELRHLCHVLEFKLETIQIKEDLFDNAKTVERYPKEMYFRLLCGQILPESLERVLYLDPDILVINSVTDLWELDLQGKMMAACTHTGLIDFTTTINKVRLNTDHGYYNSGVLLIDLNLARQYIKASEIENALEKFNQRLLLPDQDILNHLYGKYILEIPEEIYNYDGRRFMSYLTRSMGEHNLMWVMENTVILHFCGKPKPWDSSSDSRFTAMYLNYQHQKTRLLRNLG